VQLNLLLIIPFSIGWRWVLAVYCVIAREFWIDGIGWGGKHAFHHIVDPVSAGNGLSQRI